jgi:23S rRNA (uridine2552-2'-O)-methyltransferase
MADYKKPDYWQLKARKDGYPARSVYKLQEMDQKFGLFKPGRPKAGVLDIGAAPGSWSLYALRKMISTGGFLVAADLNPLSREYDKGLFDGGNFFFVQGDIASEPVRGSILSRGPYSLILSDAAPSTTGNHTVDTARSLELAEAVVVYAEESLASGGNMVIKIFQGGDSADLLKRIKTLFKNAKSHKPQACRSESVETYYVGLGRK